jgi:hypothetical protein
MSKTVRQSTSEHEFEWGAPNIGKIINRKPRQVYHIAETRPEVIPGLRKVGASLVLHVPTWRRSFEGGAA